MPAISRLREKFPRLFVTPARISSVTATREDRSVRRRERQNLQLLRQTFDTRIDLLDRLLAVQELQFRLATHEAKLLHALRESGTPWPEPDAHGRPEPPLPPRRPHNRYDRKAHQRKRRSDDE